MAKTTRKIKKNNEPKIYNKRIFELVHERIAITGETYKDIFKHLGIGYSALHQLKTGTSAFTVEQLISSANLFNISLDWICGRTDERGAISTPSPGDLDKLIENKINERLKHYFPQLNK